MVKGVSTPLEKLNILKFKLCSGMAFYLNLDKKIVQYYQNKEGKDEYTVSDMWSGLAYSAAYSI